MKPIIFSIIIVLCPFFIDAQSVRSNLGEKIDTTSLQLDNLTRSITDQQDNAYDKAKTLLNWLSNRLEWKATDYKTRTVNQILARGGGNCFELAKVYMAMIKSIQLPFRPITEINLHITSDQRQKTAESKVIQNGNRMSVFGRQHNDHRWLEVFDEKNNKWEPVDPSMNVIGTEQWLKARAWFGDRITIDTSITNDMIIPFAIFVVGDNFQLTQDRTVHYVSSSFNQLYKNQLAILKSWNTWNQQLSFLTLHAKAAFEGKENLHLYADKISLLIDTYHTLKKEFLQKH